MEESTEDRILRESITAEVKRQVHNAMIPLETMCKEKTVLNIGMLNSEVARQMEPLVTEVKRLTTLVQQYGNVLTELKEFLLEEPATDLFTKTLKDSSLYSRVKVYLQMEYLNFVLQGEGCCTDEEMNKADEWSKKASLLIVRTVNSWMQDGAPMVHRTIPEVPPEDRSKLQEGNPSSD
jgi:hypothetical protein